MCPIGYGFQTGDKVGNQDQIQSKEAFSAFRLCEFILVDCFLQQLPLKAPQQRILELSLEKQVLFMSS